MNALASRKSQSPAEIAANLSMKQKPKQRATAGYATRARRPNASDTFGWYQTTEREISLGAAAEAQQQEPTAETSYHRENAVKNETELYMVLSNTKKIHWSPQIIISEK